MLAVLSKQAIKRQARNHANVARELWGVTPPELAAREKNEVINACIMARINYPECTKKDLPFSLRVWPEMLKTQAPEWWGRQIKKADRREAEAHELTQGRVNFYCSDLILNARRENKKDMAEMLAKLLAICETPDGERVERDLTALIAASPANPAIRRAELMTRCRGFENYATAQKHCAYFFTFTAPSRFHRNSGGRWDGSTPRVAHAYLCEVWARARAELARQKIPFYGFRIAEPHKDGCPHWHCLFWFEGRDHARRASQVLRGYFLQDTPTEVGARRRRVTIKVIDNAKGSATGYIAKYICKNVDGTFNDKGQPQTFDDARRDPTTGDMKTTGLSSNDAAARVEAWASCWGIRQFQQIGGPRVGVWRELRRLGEGAGTEAALEPMRAAADKGQWDLFVQLDATHRTQYGRRVKVWSRTSADMIAALPTDAPLSALKTCLSKWQEPSRRETLGVLFGPDLRHTVKTRFLKWVLMLKAATDAAAKRINAREFIAAFTAKIKAGRMTEPDPDFCFFGFEGGAAPPRYPLEFCQ